jgi:hypothetical protein
VLLLNSSAAQQVSPRVQLYAAVLSQLRRVMIQKVRTAFVLFHIDFTARIDRSYCSRRS